MMDVLRVSRCVALGCSLSDSGRQSKSVYQKQLREALDLGGAVFVEVAAVCSFVAIKADEMGPVFHRRSNRVFCLKCINSIEKTHATRAVLVGVKLHSSPFQNPSKHYPSGCEMTTPQVVFRLAIVLCDSRRNMIRRIYLFSARVDRLSPITPCLWVIGTRRQVTEITPGLAQEFNNYAVTTTTTSEESVPRITFLLSGFRIKRLYVGIRSAEMEIHPLRAAMRTV